jgi:hypothetical protein
MLQHRDIRHFDVRQIPSTPAGRAQQRLSLRSIQEFWLHVLDRGYAYRSKHGVPSLSQWPESEFYTTELIWLGYQQWCDDARRQQRQSKEELGLFLNSLYRSSRPYQAHPTHEIEQPLAWAKPEPLDPRQPQMPYAETSNPREEPSAEGDGRPPDDVAGVVVCGRNQRGYRVGTLEEARARFEEVLGPLDPPWRQPIE